MKLNSTCGNSSSSEGSSSNGRKCSSNYSTLHASCGRSAMSSRQSTQVTNMYGAVSTSSRSTCISMHCISRLLHHVHMRRITCRTPNAAVHSHCWLGQSPRLVASHACCTRNLRIHAGAQTGTISDSDAVSSLRGKQNGFCYTSLH
jgi:hypothetical protein